jgi:serine/threonine protein kinase/sugar lactone lactonase YvrE
MVGRSVSHYQVIEKLGEGGMGVVYKARDTHLDRFVAIKVLPPERVADPERKRRFVQEAKAASALNHPNIIHIYDISSEAGLDFIAMEYVPGKTLDQLTPRKGLPLNQTLKYAVQIADALSRAHSAGIVHRDLKPSNIMVDEHSLVKVLDFGLAKLTEAAALGEEEPTRTLKPHTEEGAIVGTVAYMSPEQAEGKPVDARSDIFSFGSVLYELLTGRHAFQGNTRLSTLAAIIKEDPKPVRAVVEGVPGELERVITRCLRKDPGRRFQTMADLKVALEELKEESDSGKLASAEAALSLRLRRPSALRIAAFAVPLVAVLVAGFLWLRSWRGAEEEKPLVTTMLTSEPEWEGFASFSPDGTSAAYSRATEDFSSSDVYVKLIGEEKPLRLTETRKGAGYAGYVEWSPDGRSVAFARSSDLTREGKASLWLVPRIGGTERKLGEATWPSFPDHPMSWTADGAGLVIVDKENPQQPFALFLLSVQTGQKRRLTSPPPGIQGDTGAAVSPDGRSLVLVRRLRSRVSDLYRLDLAPGVAPLGEPRKLTSGVPFANWPVWTPDGRTIVFCSGIYHDSTLWRVPADGSRQPAPLPFVGQGSYAPAIAPQGNRLVYMKHVWDTNIWRVELGAPSHAAGPPRVFIQSTVPDSYPRYAPNGSRVAFCSERSGKREIWLCDPDGSNTRQLTSAGGRATSMDWSPDSQRLAFVSEAEGNPEIYVISVDGGPPQRLTKHAAEDTNPRWSTDGQWIYFYSNRTGARQVWKVPAGGGEAVLTQTALLGTESPDGKYVYSARAEPARLFSLWRAPVEGREATKLLDSLARADVAVTSRGIYYIAAEGPQAGWSLEFRDSATGKTSTITAVKGGTGTGLAVSPDGKWVLYTQADRETADLVLVENFR